MANVGNGGLTESNEDTAADDYERFYDSTRITDAMYGDLKADMMRVELAKTELTKLNKFDDAKQQEYNKVKTNFEQITRRYNNARDYIRLDWVGSTDKADVRNEVDQLVKDKLPTEVRRMFTSVNWIVDDGTMNLSTLGYVSNNQQINLIYSDREEANKNPKSLLATLLHELGHVIDTSSGTILEKTDLNKNQTIENQPSQHVYGFSSTKEFIDLWSTYFPTNQNIWEYVSQQSPENRNQPNAEAFAEGWSQYLMKRFYGKPYTQYIRLTQQDLQTAHLSGQDGVIPVEMDKDGVDQIIRETFADRLANPWAKMEGYFAALYNKLFEQKRDHILVPRSVEKAIAVQNHKILLGAKPTIETKWELLDGNQGIIQRTYDTTYTLDEVYHVAKPNVTITDGEKRLNSVESTEDGVNKITITRIWTVENGQPKETVSREVQPLKIEAKNATSADKTIVVTKVEQGTDHAIETKTLSLEANVTTNSLSILSVMLLSQQKLILLHNL
ncbi:hypothetical protein D3X11_01635 [Streptococcus sp. X16XC17]|uniref:hypothetical protein n=1 Tax=Streptococcus sp. X13SY08 TaxID=1676616 RepID=UPI00066FF2B7|nr:hypothetical protein [Streptococcus sp. X13SY08]TCD46184.1 hypothetical protein D3X11_01635 [Streptococcus sp. X16XC17]